ncbi:MAG: two-component regulator propeller domain-containing protein [Bacteroidota bacterium]
MKKRIKNAMLVSLIALTNIASAQTFTTYTTVQGLPDNYISGGVAIDNNNNKWFGTAAGVAKYNDVSWTVYTTTQGLIDNYTTCIAVDHNNNVWVGTNSGVSMYNGSTWTNYTTTQGLIDNGVFCIAGDIDGRVWIGTGSGVSEYDAGTWTNYTTVQGLPSDVVKSITVDALGNKWFGTQMGGFSKYNDVTFLNFSKTIAGTTLVDSLLDDNVFAITIDNDSTSYIGTWMGISVFDKNLNWVRNIRMSTDSIYNDYIRDLEFDNSGHLWGGFFADYNLDGGISYYDNYDWTSYSVPQGLADKQVINLAIDDNNDIWIATGNGASKLSNPAGINNICSSPNFNIFPNPANNSVTIELKENRDVKSIELFNAAMQKSEEFLVDGFTSKVSISLEKYTAGLYFIKIGNSVEKLVISK